MEYYLDFPAKRESSALKGHGSTRDALLSTVLTLSGVDHRSAIEDLPAEMNDLPRTVEDIQT